MSNAPKWFTAAAVLALLWNLLGCAAFLGDAMTTPEQVAKMTPDQQELYRARPGWALGATAVAVWGGAAGSLGLLLRKRWATLFLIASLVGVVVQDIGLFGMTKAVSLAGPAVFALQGLVLVVSVALVLLAHRAEARGWIT